MDHPVTEEESYANRRQLFKNIWDTALNIVKKEEENKEGIDKHKVIKTARIDEVHRCRVGKKKKQRLKNLRIVCNKILDFCDRQDADDMFYEQMSSKGKRRNKRRMLKESQKIRKEKAAKMFTIQDVLQIGISSPDPFLSLDKSSTNSSMMNVKDIKETLLGVQENYRKRRKRKRVENFTDVKMLLQACHKNSNKRLFPVNKIYIS